MSLTNFSADVVLNVNLSNSDKMPDFTSTLLVGTDWIEKWIIELGPFHLSVSERVGGYGCKKTFISKLFKLNIVHIKNGWKPNMKNTEKKYF